MPPSPREELAALLSIDFTLPEKAAAEQEAEREAAEREAAGGVSALSLKGFLAKSRAVEDIEARLESDECAELLGKVSGLLEAAPVTDSFKGIIVGHMMRAYAWETKVDELVSPERLGLVGGEGIFDPEQAKPIESQALRGFLFDITNNHVLVPEGEGVEEGAEPIIPDPAVYAIAMEGFDAWTLDYMTTYSEDAFAGIDPEAYREAAKRVRVMTEEESVESGFSGLIEKLRELRDKNPPK